VSVRSDGGAAWDDCDGFIMFVFLFNVHSSCAAAGVRDENIKARALASADMSMRKTPPGLSMHPDADLLVARSMIHIHNLVCVYNAFDIRLPYELAL